MNSPQFKRGNVGIFNRRVFLSESRQVDAISLAGLHVSKFLLYAGIILILLNNLNVFAPGSYFGAYNWVTIAVFSIGLSINFISIPFLYFSSLKNFKKESEFWDEETFWILPLFFFGTFFLYNSQIEAALLLLMMSVAIIILIHVKFILDARKNILSRPEGMLSDCGQYFMTLKYLTAYYILLLVMLVSCDPLRQTFIWIRLHA